MLAAAAADQVQHPVLAVLGVVVLVVLMLLLVLLELLTQAVVAEVVVMLVGQEPQAVQVLSFFATPAQVNISLVAR
jgi:hypothetical protein